MAGLPAVCVVVEVFDDNCVGAVTTSSGSERTITAIVNIGIGNIRIPTNL